jgi:uncharacterized protein
MLRKVINPPVIKGFKPYGQQKDQSLIKVVTMLFEEYEALRLCDYDMVNHHQASVIMGVSRPTFTRIYAAARRKVAKAFVEGSQISIEGGKVYFDSDWYHCKACKSYFNNPEKEKPISVCPLCKSSQISNYEWQDDIDGDTKYRCRDACMCVNCGYEQMHEYGRPCSEQVCPECQGRMVRNARPGSRHHKKHEL